MGAEEMIEVRKDKSSKTTEIYTHVSDKNVGKNEEPCGKPQGINSHITNTAAATLWQATGNYQVKSPVDNLQIKGGED
jgi:hypothetical protein